MKQLILLIAIFVIVNVPSTILISNSLWTSTPRCENTRNLHEENSATMMDSIDPNKSRLVYKTKFKAEADKIVYITPFIAEADSQIYVSKIRAEITQSKGIWFWTKIKQESDWKIYITKYKSEADIIVYYSKTKPF